MFSLLKPWHFQITQLESKIAGDDPFYNNGSLYLKNLLWAHTFTVFSHTDLSLYFVSASQFKDRQIMVLVFTVKASSSAMIFLW